IVYERISLTSRRMAGYCVELLNVIRRRPFTYLLSVLVSFGLLFCLIVISDSLMIDEPLTQVAINPPDDLTISAIYIEIDYRRDGDSRLNVIVSFPGTTNNSGKVLEIFTSANLHRSPYGSYKGSQGGVHTQDSQHNYYQLGE